MRSRTVLLSAATALLVAAPTVASAAPVCKLVEDPADDAALNPALGPVLKARALDIRSMDVATGKTTVVVVLRLASTKIADDPMTMQGVEWHASFTLAGETVRFSRKITNAGAVTDTAKAGETALSGVKVTVTGDSITWTTPRSSLRKLKKKATLSGFFADTTTNGAFDLAPNTGYGSTRTYTDRAASCVKAK
ncbi:MAG TPA: hypothetical protein VNA20_01330 [Frankiaceae bacterium]|nr:hypothetical protein [Frankiaceae bacterium]